jgi:hypothetical protein
MTTTAPTIKTPSSDDLTQFCLLREVAREAHGILRVSVSAAEAIPGRPHSTPATTEIDGRTYRVERTVARPSRDSHAVDLRVRGFDGAVYRLTGQRGAERNAYRHAATGAFVLVAGARS